MRLAILDDASKCEAATLLSTDLFVCPIRLRIVTPCVPSKRAGATGRISLLCSLGFHPLTTARGVPEFMASTRLCELAQVGSAFSSRRVSSLDSTFPLSVSSRVRDGLVTTSQKSLITCWQLARVAGVVALQSAVHWVS